MWPRPACPSAAESRKAGTCYTIGVARRNSGRAESFRNRCAQLRRLSSVVMLSDGVVYSHTGGKDQALLYHSQVFRILFEEGLEMMRLRPFRSVLLVTLGFAVGSLFMAAWQHSTALAQRENAAAPSNPQADLDRLKSITPPMSHPMVDVGYHAANLWFAVQKKNWPLANYYWGETRNRLRWEVALNPGPKGTDGNPVDMKGTLDGIEHGSLAKVKDTIDQKNGQQF